MAELAFTDLGTRNRTVPALELVGSTDLTVSAVRTFDGLIALKPDYDSLNLVAKNTIPYALHEWHVTWWKHFSRAPGRAGDKLLILVVRNRAGACSAIIPLVESRTGISPFRATALRILGSDGGATDIRSPLIQPGMESAVIAAVRQHLANVPGWNWIHWNTINADFNKALEGKREIYREQALMFYVLDLKPTWEEFHAGLRRRTRQALRRSYTALEKGSVPFEFAVAESPQDVKKAIERFLELHAMRAKTESQVRHPDRFADPLKSAFLYDVCDQLAKRGVTRVFTMKIEGQIVAAQIGFAVGNSIYMYYSGFDPKWWNEGIMTTTWAEAIKYAIRCGLPEVNLSLGTNRSKTRWNPRAVPYETAFEPRHDLVSNTACALYRFGRNVYRMVHMGTN